LVHTTMVIVVTDWTALVCAWLAEPSRIRIVQIIIFEISMALSLARCLRFSKHLSVSRACNVSVRSFAASSPIFRRRRAPTPGKVFEARRTRSVLEDDMDELAEQWDDFSEIKDSSSAGHIMLQELRQTLHYLRLIEHEMPKLVGVFL
jgi:hypothetical protein